MSEAIRILIVDDHPMVREGLTTLLSDEPDLLIADQAGSGEEALEKLETVSPHVVLMDVVLPGMDGISTTKEVRSRMPSARVILLTSSIVENLRLQHAIEAGAIGYLLKDVAKGELLTAIRNAHRGIPTLHADVQKQLLHRAAGERLPHEELTGREFQVLCEIARGKSNKVIAGELGISEGTVKGYVSVIFSKLGVADRTQAALYAVRHRLTG
jgi:two-component system, NarL family, response regulator LiaR